MRSRKVLLVGVWAVLAMLAVAGTLGGYASGPRAEYGDVVMNNYSSAANMRTSA